MHRVVEDDPVGVLDDLGPVTELDGFAEAALADRAGVGLMQRHESDGTVRLPATYAGAGLIDDLVGALDEDGEIVEHPANVTTAGLVS